MGTRIYSDLDVAERPLASGQAAARRAPAGLRLLVVEDEPEAARLLAGLLHLVGHQTEIALDAEEALQAAERLQPDAVVLDLGLPGMGGIELARRLRLDAHGRRPLLIALTAFTGDEVRWQALQAGVDHYLSKPLDFEQLCRLLTRRPPD